MGLLHELFESSRIVQGCSGVILIDYQVRAAFARHITELRHMVGTETTNMLWPCYEQALLDTEPVVHLLFCIVAWLIALWTALSGALMLSYFTFFSNRTASRTEVLAAALDGIRRCFEPEPEPMSSLTRMLGKCLPLLVHPSPEVHLAAHRLVQQV